MTDLYSSFDSKKRKDYERGISSAIALSRLFSDNLYLNSKVMERAFCKYLMADNIALDNVPVDAKMIVDSNTYGIGLKTFGICANTKKSTEKIAEFDKLKHSYTKDPIEDARLVIDAWNDRIEETTSIYNIDTFRYHCLTRYDNIVSVIECPFGKLDSNVSGAKQTVGGFKFEMGGTSYSYNYGKSVLNRSFDVRYPITQFRVKVFDDPFDIINRFYDSFEEEMKPVQKLVLPLFGYKSGKPYVFPKSGLNQWNAGGRKRSASEVYIPYNKRERDAVPGFFPEYIPGDRGCKEHFKVHLPSGKTVEASLCQSDGKGIMSKDNDDFGEWLLYKVLNVEPEEIVTIDTLEDRGINAVVFTKLDDREYSLDFTYVDSLSDSYN